MVCPFRIDRIIGLQITEESIISDTNFCIKQYLHGAFRMFTGRMAEVVLECSNDWMNSVFDHFGNDVNIERVSSEAFRIKVSVQLSPTFYAWIFEAGSRVKIIEPVDVVEEYKELLIGILEEYT